MRNKALLRIAITGPESTGKTTLAQALADHFQTVWTPEYARTYLDTLDRAYAFNDLEQIARGQLKWEAEYGAKARRFLFCDTDLLVLKVWSEYKYGRCAPFILEALRQQPYALHILCGTDVPWEYDPLRENPGERAELYGIYLAELQGMGLPFMEVRGSLEERLAAVADVIK
ncbi:MAG: ATP-binding protein [Saprospirales bacterium]|nr:ATP-binding protein [Saprospirales bacterium]